MYNITSDYLKATAARAIPGAYYENGSWWLKDPTPKAALIALKLFPGLYVHEELRELRDSLAQDVRPVDNATPYGKRISDEIPDFGTAWRASKLCTAA